MKKILIWVISKTIGSFLRILQKNLLVRNPAGERFWGDGRNATLWDGLYKSAQEDSVEYVKANMQSALYLPDRLKQIDWLANQIPISKKSNSDLIILEFGVFTGISLNYIAKKFPSTIIYGFDSFEGLEEDWVGSNSPKGLFDLKGKLPIVEPNVELIKGWFEESLPNFISTRLHGAAMIHLLHIDCDTYTPTIFLLEALAPYFKKDTIILFDEYFNYPGWKHHEFKAFQDFVTKHDISYEYICFSESPVAVRLTKCDVG